MEFVRLKIDVSKEKNLLFLIDTGADTSLIKGGKLIGTTEYDADKKVKVKCVDGSPMQMYGTVGVKVKLENSWIPYEFQLVNKQVDIPCDGILWHNFLQQVKAKICCENRTIELNGETYKMVGKGKDSEAEEVKAKPTKLSKLPPRAESVVKLLVSPGSPPVGVIDVRYKKES